VVLELAIAPVAGLELEQAIAPEVKAIDPVVAEVVRPIVQEAEPIALAGAARPIVPAAEPIAPVVAGAERIALALAAGENASVAAMFLGAAVPARGVPLAAEVVG
jgi:hypothetical protein